MNKLNEIEVCVYDMGIFFCVAQALAKQAKKVSYYSPWKSSFPMSSDRELGEGYPDVERIYEFERFVNDNRGKGVLYVFPDIYDGCGWQILLLSMGELVWGSREAEVLEIERWDFIQYLKKLGMAVAPSVRGQGTDWLRKQLKDATISKVIKCDGKERGDVETFHARKGEYDLTEIEIANIEQRVVYGYAKKDKWFIVQDSIEDTEGKEIDGEPGYDGYCIDGQYPEQVLFGREIKGAAYWGEVRQNKDLPESVQMVNNKFAPALRKYGMRGNISTEIILCNNKAFYIDPCMRFPSPPTELMVELWENMLECMYMGAQGIMVRPEYKGKYGAELIIYSDWTKDNDSTLFFPKDMAPYVKTRYQTMRDGKEWVLKQTKNPYNKNPRACAVIAYGNNPAKVQKEVKERALAVRGKQLDVNPDCIDAAVKELEKY